MCTEDDGRCVRDFIQLFDEYGTARAQVFDDKAVVYDLVAHIDGGAEQFNGALNDLDGAINARTEAARIG